MDKGRKACFFLGELLQMSFSFIQFHFFYLKASILIKLKNCSYKLCISQLCKLCIMSCFRMNHAFFVESSTDGGT